MNQQQATEFVTQALRRGLPRAQIVQALSQQTGAPSEKIDHFVARVEAQILPPGDAPPPAASSDAPPVPFQAAPPASPEVVPLQAPDPVRNDQPAAAAGVILPQKRYPVQKGDSVAAPKQRRAGHIHPALNDPALIAEVRSRLRNQARKSDIALSICEKVNVDWAEAQRFVNQVEVEDYRAISTIKYLPVLVAGSLMVIGGLALLVVSLISITPDSFQLPILLSPQNILTAAVTGLMMIVGGSIGIIQSWQRMQ